MNVTDLLSLYAVPLATVALAFLTLWWRIQDNEKRRDNERDNAIDNIRKEMASLIKGVETQTATIKVGLDLQLRGLESQLHRFQLDAAKDYCSAKTVEQVEERLGKQLEAVAEDLRGVRKRVDTLLDRVPGQREPI